jgi:hypothetical protein
MSEVTSVYDAMSTPGYRLSSTGGGGEELHGLSPRANYTDRVTAACRRSDCQLLRIEGAMRSA